MNATLSVPTEDSAAGEYARQLAEVIGPCVQAPDGTADAADYLAWGDLLVAAKSTVDEARKQVFVSTATDTLDDHEKLRGLPNGAGLTNAARQTRLVAKVQALRAGTAQNILAAVQVIEPAATLGENTWNIVVDPRWVFQYAIVLPDATLNNAALMAQITAIIRQMKPAQTHFVPTNQVGFYCDDPDSVCDRTVLRL